MSSFKAKLVAHFVLLSLVPLVAANLGFFRGERDRAEREADRTLAVGLRAATSAYEAMLRDAHARALLVARRPDTAAALEARNRAGMADAIAGANTLGIEAGDVRVGAFPTPAARRTAVVVREGRTLGVVTASVTFDDRLVKELAALSGLARPAGLAIAADGRVVGGLARGARVPSVLAEAFEVQSGRTDYRALAAPIGSGGTRMLALVPSATIEEQSAGALRRLLFALAVALAVIALTAYFEARVIVRALGRLARTANAIASGELRSRVPVRGRDEVATFSAAFNHMADQLQERIVDLGEARDKLRVSIGRLGDALASSHDTHHLAEVVVATAVDATGAAGGAFVVDGTPIVSQGDLQAQGRIDVDVRLATDSSGTLVLTGVEASADVYDVASSLAAHAGVAFENARLHETLAEQARTDELTGLANRRHGSELLSRELARAQRSVLPLAVVICDIDRFKAVNDAHGHATGDAVLVEFGDAIRNRLRTTDVAVRWGGEEFLFVLPDTPAEGALQLSDALRREFAARFVELPDGTKLQATASFGVATFEPGMTIDDLIARADDALYAAKRGGKDAVVLASVA